MSNTAIKELLDDFFMTPSAVSVTGTDMPGLLYLRLIKNVWCFRLLRYLTQQ